MAKKKSPPETPTPGLEKAELTIINLKGTATYRKWLAEFAKATHYPASTLFRLAMTDLAKKLGHQPPPEK